MSTNIIDEPWAQARMMWDAIKKHEEMLEAILRPGFAEPDSDPEKIMLRANAYRETSKQKDTVIDCLLQHIKELTGPWVN